MLSGQDEILDPSADWIFQKACYYPCGFIVELHEHVCLILSEVCL